MKRILLFLLSLLVLQFIAIKAVAQNIQFADATVKSLCVANWDANRDGELSRTEAAAVTDLYSVFKSNRQITTFNELQYFTGLTKIGVDAFQGCNQLKSVIIPSTVSTLGVRCFQNSGLTSINIPTSVKTIEEYAFGNIKIESAYIPKTVETIKSNPFLDCIYLSKIEVAADNPYYDSRNNCNAIIKINGSVLVSGCKSTIIPDGVIELGSYAFSGCEALYNIGIPNSIQTIDSYAFGWCSNLKSIYIPASVKFISHLAFSMCDLSYAQVASTNTKYDSRNNCNAIIETSSNKLIVGTNNTVIPNTVRIIGNGAFEGKKQLKTIDISVITAIESSAFSYCTALSSIELPNSIEKIESSVFFYCSALTSITIPQNIKSIGSYAFAYCSNLNSIVSLIEEPSSIDNDVFSTFTTATLYVPNGTKAKYQATDGWKQFTNIVEMGETDCPPLVLTYNTDGFGVTQSQQSSINANSFTYCLSYTDIVNEIGISLDQFETNYSYDGYSRVFNQYYMKDGVPTAVTTSGSATDALGTIRLVESIDNPSRINWIISADELSAYAAKIDCDPARANVVRIVRFVKNSSSTLPASQYPTYIYVMLTPASFTVDVQEPEPDCPPLFLTYSTGSLRVTNSPYTGITAYPFGYNHSCADIVNEVGISQSLFESNYSYDGAAREFNQFYLKDGVPTAVTSNGSATDALGTISLSVSPEEQQPFIIKWSITDYELATYAAKIGYDPARANVERIVRFVKNSSSTLPASQYPTYIYVMLSPESFTISQGTLGYGILNWDNEYNIRDIDYWYNKNGNTPASGLVEIHAQTLIPEDQNSTEYTEYADSLTIHLPDVFTKGINPAGVPNKLITPTNAAYNKFVTIKGTTEISGKDLKLDLVFVDSTYKSQTFNANNGKSYKLCVIPNTNGKALGAYESTYANWERATAAHRDTIAIMYFDTNYAVDAKDSINHWQVGYRSNAIADALLNYKAQNELTNDVVKAVVGVKASYNDVTVPMTNNTFDIRFLRPINAYGVGTTVDNNIINEDIIVNLRDLVMLSDWRNHPFMGNYWSYYGITDIQVVGVKPNYDLSSNSDILTNIGQPEGTMPQTRLADVEELAYFIYSPRSVTPESGAIPDGSAYGTIIYRDLGNINQSFIVRVPLRIKYLWGEVYTTADIQFHSSHISDNVTISAYSYTRKYGDDNPMFDYTITDGTITSGTPMLTCEATTTSPVGTYPIVILKGSVSNSSVELVNGTLTITKAPLTIKAGTYTKKQGEENPEFTLTYEGFKNNETESVLTKKPTVTCIATVASEPGEYEVTVSGGEAQNYELSYVSGTLTVTVVNGISELTNVTNADVYDTQGRKVCTQGTNIEALPKGVYIVGGKKRFVK